MDRYRHLVYILAIFGLFIVNIPLFAATIVVPHDQPTIQAGIDAAVDGDSVLVESGTYKGDGNVNIDFQGKEITVKSRNGASLTIIDCERTPSTRGFTFENGETTNATLDGFTIMNGRHTFGGGIYCNNASPTIKNCVITQNSVVKDGKFTGYGGGVYGFNSEMKVIDCTISNNSSESYGSGVYFEGDVDYSVRSSYYQPTMSKCVVSDNSGVGIYCLHQVSLTVRDSEVLRNEGRGVVCTSFSLGGTHVVNCLISENKDGGLECAEHSVLYVTDSYITRNSAEYGGGIYSSPTARTNVSDCVIAENTAYDTGGGIQVASTFGNVLVEYCTITQNSAVGKGGGINAFLGGTTFKLTDSILWGNSSEQTSHPELFVSGPTATVLRCNIRDGIDGIDRGPEGDRHTFEDIIDVNPQFVDANSGDYRLKRGSNAAGMGVQELTEDALSVSSVGKKVVIWGDLKRR